MKLRVAMLSKWHVHATDYARTIRSFDDAEITCVWDEDADRGRAWAAELGVPFEENLDSLLARDDVDAVIVDTPTTAHRDVMVAAANAGKHIFTEKVLATTVAECKDIAEAVKDAGVKFCISYPQRTGREIQYIKQVIDQGLLGKVSMLRIRNAHNGASGGWLPEYWYDTKAAGGGAMLDLGCHPNYQATYLLGKPKRAAAMFDSLVCPPDVEDNAVSVFEFENGAIAILETGFVTPYSPWRLEVMGTEGTVLFDEGKLRIRSNKLPMAGWFYPDVNTMPEALPMPLRQWVDGILKGTPIVFGMEDAIALTEMMEAAYISHREGLVLPVFR